MGSFWHYELRTTDATAARDFYRSVLGHERAVVWPLHEEALARGAKPHWLGNLGVAEPELAVRRFMEAGAVPLGPTRDRPDGGRISVLRDPGGAIFAVTSRPAASAEPTVHVAFHALSTSHLERAAALYADVFGWEVQQKVETGPVGSYRPFAWEAGAENVGVMSDVEGRPGVHPHWLFFFQVPSLDSAMSRAQSLGGALLAPVTLASGARCCVGDDPQGAAFGLWESPR
jgi:predicted enzyme related to lactoylglutathione lyase